MDAFWTDVDLTDLDLFQRIKAAQDHKDWQAVNNLCEEALHYYGSQAPSAYAPKTWLLSAQGDALQRLKDFDAAWLQMHEALLSAYRIEEPGEQEHWLGILLHDLADIHFDRQEPGIAELLLKQSLSPLRRSEQHSLLTHVLLDLAAQARKRDDFSEAEFRLEEARGAAQRAQDPGYEVSVLRALGEVRFSLGQIESSTELLKQACELAKEIDDEEARLKAFIKISSLAFTLQDWDTVRNICSTNTPIALNGYPALAIDFLSHSGYVFAKAKKWTEAQRDYKEALLLARQEGSDKQILSILHSCTRAAIDDNDNSTAFTYLQEYLPLAIETNDSDRILNSFYLAMIVLLRKHQFVSVAQLIGVMDRFRETAKESAHAENYSWLEAQTQRYLPSRWFRKWRQTGASLTLPEAITLALKERSSVKRRWLPVFPKTTN